MAGIPSGRQQGNIKRFTHSMHRLVWWVEFTLPIIIVSLEIGDLIHDKGFDRLPAKLGDTREVSAFVKVGEFGPSPLAYLLVAHHDFTVLFCDWRQRLQDLKLRPVGCH